MRLGLDPGEPEPLVVLPAARVGDEQLDARLGVRRLAGVEQAQLAAAARVAAGDQRREALGPLGRERAVEHVEQLLARPEVGGQRPHARLAERHPALAEDRHVGVAEAVDRLELVADREQVVALQGLEDVELEPVRVLELVDHDQPEALGPALAAGRVGGEQVAHVELEVVEVEARAAGLGLRVGGAEAREQVGDLDQREPRVMVGAALAVGGPGRTVGRARRLVEGLQPLLELGVGEHGGDRHAIARAEHALAALQRVERLLELLAAPGGGEAARRLRARGGELGRIRVAAPAAGPAGRAASARASAASSGRRARGRAARPRTRPRRRPPPRPRAATQASKAPS